MTAKAASDSATGNEYNSRSTSTILVDGNQYINCTFQNCEIMFGGYDPPAMPNTVFDACQFGLTIHAELTKNWLRFISGAGGPGTDSRIDRTERC